MSSSGPEVAQRLQKVLARAGIGSRRACEELIRAGRVVVNGSPAALGDRADPLSDVVEIDGIRVALDPALVYIALHKPTGVVTTAQDTHGRPTVLDLLEDGPRVFPVGRLDMDTSGLLLLTNDGDFANRVAHPRYEVPKTYVAEVRGRFRASRIEELTRGVDLEDGPARADTARVHGADRDRTVVEVTVREGRNRLVRRMFEAVGTEVVSLVRTSIGPITLAGLPEGSSRELERSEVLELLRAGQPLD